MEVNHETEAGNTDSSPHTVRRDRNGDSSRSVRTNGGMLLPVRLTRNTLGLIGWR
jgi:hypothetical protein